MCSGRIDMGTNDRPTSIPLLGKKNNETFGSSWEVGNGKQCTCPFFTCGRRPAGLLVTLIVVVDDDVVVWGNNFYTWAF